MAHSIIIPLAGMLMTFGIVYVVITAWNRQNLSMIEAGMNPKKSKQRRHSQLRIALLMVCVPIGILTGNLVHPLFGMDPEPTAVVFSFLFGGVALVGTYFIEESKSTPFEEE